MANRQTRYLATLQRGTLRHRGPGSVDLPHVFPTVIARPLFKGKACDTSFANAPDNGNKRKHARLYKPDEHMTVKIQAEMLGLTRRISNERE